MPIHYRTADGKPPMGGMPPNWGLTVPKEPAASPKKENASEESKVYDCLIQIASSSQLRSAQPVVYVPLPSCNLISYPPCGFHYIVPVPCSAEKEGKDDKKEKKDDKKDKKKDEKKKDKKKEDKKDKKKDEGKKDKKKDEGPPKAWTMPKPPEPKAPAKKEKAKKDEASKEKSKKDEAPKEKASSPPGTVLLPPLVKIHLLKRAYKPWVSENAGKSFQFKQCQAPPSITVKELIKVLFEGMKVKDDEKVVVECLERGGGKWSRGSVWKHDDDESKQRLGEIGWLAKRGTEMKPVWLAWGIADL